MACKSKFKHPEYGIDVSWRSRNKQTWLIYNVWDEVTSAVAMNGTVLWEVSTLYSDANWSTLQANIVLSSAWWKIWAAASTGSSETFYYMSGAPSKNTVNLEEMIFVSSLYYFLYLIFPLSKKLCDADLKMNLKNSGVFEWFNGLECYSLPFSLYR
jgi:hypothetical protein